MATYPILAYSTAWRLIDFNWAWGLDNDGGPCFVVDSVVQTHPKDTTLWKDINKASWSLDFKKGNTVIFNITRLDTENNYDGTFGASCGNTSSGQFGARSAIGYADVEYNWATIIKEEFRPVFKNSGAWLIDTWKIIDKPVFNSSIDSMGDAGLQESIWYTAQAECKTQHRYQIDPNLIKEADTVDFTFYYASGGEGWTSTKISKPYNAPKQDDPPPPPIDPPVPPPPPPPPPPPLVEAIEEPCGYVPQFAGEQVLVYFNGNNLGYVPVDDQGYLPEYWPPLPNPNAVRICDANQLVVGLGYNTEIIPTRPEVQTEQGLTMGLLRKVNAVKAKTYRYVPCLVNVGTSQARWCGNGYNKEVTLQAVPLGAGWRDFENLTITASGPSPATILALITTVELSNFPGKR